MLVDIDDEGGRRAAEDLGGHYVHCDVTDADEVEAMVAEADATFGSVDIAFSNAGINPSTRPATARSLTPGSTPGSACKRST